MLAPPRARARRQAAHRRQRVAAATTSSRSAQDPFLGFPGLESRPRRSTTSRAGYGVFDASSSGMLGPQGALPLTTTEEAYSWRLATRRCVPALRRPLQQPLPAAVLPRLGRCAADRPARPARRGPLPRLSRLDDRHRLAAFRDLDSDRRFRQARIRRAARSRRSRAHRGCAACIAGLFGVSVEIEQFVGTMLRTRSKASVRVIGKKNSAARPGHAGRQAASTASGQVPHPPLCQGLRGFREVPARWPLCGQIADAVFFYLGDEFDWDVELAIPAGEIAPVQARLGRPARLDELDGAELGGDRRDISDATRASILANRRREEQRRNRRDGVTMARHQPRIGHRQAEPGRLRRLHPGAAARQERRQPQCRARALALPHPAAGPHRHRAAPPITSSSTAPSCWPTSAAVVERLPQERDRDAGHLQPVTDVLDRGWHYATLFFGETQIRTGHVLVAALKSLELQARAHQPVEGIRARLRRRRRSPPSIARNLGRVRRREPAADGRLRASRRRARRAPPRRAGPTGTTALDRFSQDLTAKADVRQDGPDPRPRRRDPPDHRRADAPAPEQPDPDRRGGRRQDRRRRRLRPDASPPATCRRRSRACGSARSTSA